MMEGRDGSAVEIRETRFSEDVEGEGNGDEDDVVTLYGATKNTTAIHAKLRPHSEDEAMDPALVDVGELGLAENLEADVVLLAGNACRHGLSQTNDSYLINSSVIAESVIVTKTFPFKQSVSAVLCSWWHHPKVQENYRVILASVLLTLFGTCLAVAGIAIEVSQIKSVQSYMFFAAGAICLIPGVYHLVYFFCAIKGVSGFSFYNMPVFK